MNGFNVKEILDFRYNDRVGRQEWKVKWNEFDMTTWEPWENLVASEKFHKYLQVHGAPDKNSISSFVNNTINLNNANNPFQFPTENLNTCVHRATVALIRKNYDEVIMHIKNAYVYGKIWSPSMINLLKEAWKAQAKGERISYRKMKKLLSDEINPQLAQILKHEQYLIAQKMVEVSKFIQKVAKSVIKKNNKNSDETNPMNYYESVENDIEWYALVAEHFVYLLEMLEGEDRTEAKYIAMRWYNQAYEVAYKSLMPHNPLRVHLVLQYSEFLAKHMSNLKLAINISKTAFDLAVKHEIEAKNQSENYFDVTKTLQMIKDNVDLWNKMVKQQRKSKD
jgi:hypothetical protein